MIWAYLVALLEVAREFETNHPGLLILDEPQQQNVNDISFDELLKRLASTKASGQQAIIALSRVSDEMKSWLRKEEQSLVEISGWVLQPLVS
jgi:ABC-type molybdenum transport system ATPase subunit/photorepair protein PhrA